MSMLSLFEQIKPELERWADRRDEDAAVRLMRRIGDLIHQKADEMEREDGRQRRRRVDERDG